MGIGIGSLPKYIAKYREKYPEWFDNFEDSTGKAREHYSAELGEKILQEYSMITPVPQDWDTIHHLAKSLGVTFKVVDRYAKTYKETNPGWFKFFRDYRGHKHEFLSPELIESIKNRFKADRSF